MSERTQVAWLNAAQTAFGVLLTAGLATTGWFLQQAYYELSSMRERVTTVEVRTEAQSQTQSEMAASLRRLADLTGEAARQSAERRGSRFTAEQGVQLQLQVGEHATLIATQATTLAEIKDDLNRLESGMNRIWEAVRSRTK